MGLKTVMPKQFAVFILFNTLSGQGGPIWTQQLVFAR